MRSCVLTRIKNLSPRPTPAHYKELIKLHKIESRMKTINAVSDKGIFTIQQKNDGKIHK